jgi:hypothetical protein
MHSFVVVLAAVLSGLVPWTLAEEEDEFTELIPVPIAQKPHIRTAGDKRSWVGTPYELRDERKFLWLSPLGNRRSVSSPRQSVMLTQMNEYRFGPGGSRQLRRKD